MAPYWNAFLFIFPLIKCLPFPAASRSTQRRLCSAAPGRTEPPQKGSRPRLALVSPRWSVGLRTSSYISEILMQYIDSSSFHHHPPLPLPNCLPRTLNVSYLARLPPIGSTLGSLRCPVGDYGGGATMYFQRYGAAVTYRDGPGTHIYIPLTSS